MLIWTPTTDDDPDGIEVEMNNKAITGKYIKTVADVRFEVKEMKVGTPGAQRVLFRVHDYSRRLGLGGDCCVAKQFSLETRARHLVQGFDDEVRPHAFANRVTACQQLSQNSL